MKHTYIFPLVEQDVKSLDSNKDFRVSDIIKGNEEILKLYRTLVSIADKKRREEQQ